MIFCGIHMLLHKYCVGFRFVVLEKHVFIMFMIYCNVSEFLM